MDKVLYSYAIDVGATTGLCIGESETYYYYVDASTHEEAVEVFLARYGRPKNWFGKLFPASGFVRENILSVTQIKQVYPHVIEFK